VRRNKSVIVALLLVSIKKSLQNIKKNEVQNRNTTETFADVFGHIFMATNKCSNKRFQRNKQTMDTLVVDG